MKELGRSVDIRPDIGTLRVDMPTGGHLEHLYADARRGLSPASVCRRHAVIDAALDRTVKRAAIAANHADRATPPGRAPSTVLAPVVDVVQQLIGARKRQGHTVLAMGVVLAAVTGAGAGSCALRWCDVDSAETGPAYPTLLNRPEGVITVGATKTHQSREVNIDQALGCTARDAMRAPRRVRRAERTSLVADAYILSRSADRPQPCLPDWFSLAYSPLVDHLVSEATSTSCSTLGHGARRSGSEVVRVSPGGQR